MFSGSCVHTVDEKSRIAMPAKFREVLGKTFVLTKGPDGCLWALPQDQWKVILARAASSVPVQRFFVASSVACSPNNKGRFLIPDVLRDYADVKPRDDVVIIGLGSRIEIWARRRWEVVSSQLTSDRLKQELPEFFEF